MQLSHSLLCTTLVCASVSAQSYVTSPVGLDKTEGATYQSSLLGNSSAARVMLFDGELRNRAMTIREVALRHEAQYVYRSLGRTWTGVTLSVAKCDMASLSKTFSSNPTSTPSQVFSQPMAWPKVDGVPNTRPAAWSIKFPFSTAWSYDGKADLLLDFTFTGGLLTNATTFSNADYYLDATYPRSDYTPPKVYGKSGYFGGCADSAFAVPVGGRLDLVARSYAASSRQPAYHEVLTVSDHTAPGAAVVHALGLLGSPAGVTMPGVSCNRIHLDVSVPFLTAVGTTDYQGYSSALYPTGRPGGYLNPAPGLVGLTLWAQAAWADSKTGGLRLTNAAETRIPPIPARAKHEWLRGSSPTATTGYGLYSYTTSNPIVRFTY